ncbi:MAG TPA: SIS domain-containing protein [bacterium]|nr:SIS domain-containing protein [bacterium]HPL95399.1 SIS domain-containing protein [bacterium]
MQPRLKRYRYFLENEYAASLINNKAHSLTELKSDLKQKIKRGQFKKIVFCGMGCSAIVAEMIKVFFIEQKIELEVTVVNDYDWVYLVAPATIKDKKTLIIVSSESGYSQEPIKFYEQIKRLTKNIIFLTSGGELEKIAAKDKVSLVRWQLKNPDQQYAVLHAPEFFVNLLNIFFEFGLTANNYERELQTASQLIKKESTAQKIEEAKKLAKKLKNREIILIASPLWRPALLRLIVMHFNELSLTAAHDNSLHEFTHCEILTLTQPKTGQALIVFKDYNENEYTIKKIQLMTEILTKKIKFNKNREVAVINLKYKNFLQNFFLTLLKMQYVAYFLGVDYNITTNNLIAKAALKYEKFKT